MKSALDFTKIFCDVTKLCSKIPTSNYLKEGKYPIIHQGLSYIAGYSDDEEGLLTDVPAIVFGDHTRIIKYVDFPFFIGADGVKVLKVKENIADFKYLYYAMLNVDIPDTGYNRHFKWLKESRLLICSAEEQIRVVSVFDKITDLIDKHHAMKTALENMVMSKFSEMFGDVLGNTVYERQELSLLGEIYTGSTPSMQEARYYESDDIPFVKPGDIGEAEVTWVKGASAFVSEKALSVVKIIPEGAVLVTCIGTIGKVGISTKECCCNQQINYIIPNESVESVYLANCLLMCKALLRETANKAVVPIINKTQFSSLKIPVPPIEQQRAFSEFAKRTDKLKSEVDFALENLELLKKSLMQKYFG